MQLILLERVEKLGQMGDIVTVKPGYGRNFLLPRGKAVRASKANVERFHSMRVELEARNLESLKEARQIAENLDNRQVTIIRQASEAGHLYGSVTARDIAEAVSTSGVAVDRKQVVIDRPVKSLGIFDFKIRLHPECDALVEINVAQSEEEAAVQADRKLRGEAVVITKAEQDAAEDKQAAADQAAAAAEAARVREEEDGETEPSESSEDAEPSEAEQEN